MDQIGIMFSEIHLLGIIQVDSFHYFVVAVTNLLSFCPKCSFQYICDDRKSPLAIVLSISFEVSILSFLSRGH